MEAPFVYGRIADDRNFTDTGKRISDEWSGSMIADKMKNHPYYTPQLR